jgi:hypothetical protein
MGPRVIYFCPSVATRKATYGAVQPGYRVWLVEWEQKVAKSFEGRLWAYTTLMNLVCTGNMLRLS